MIRRVVVVLLLLVFAGSMVAGHVFDEMLVSRGIPSQEADWPTAVAFLAFAVVGALLILYVRQNVLGPLMLGIAVGAAFSLAAANFATYSARVTDMPGTAAAGWVATWGWFPPSIALFTLLPLLFPTGRLVSPGWRWVERAAAGAIALLSLGAAFRPGPLDLHGARIENPLGIETLATVAEVFSMAGVVLTPLAILASLGSVVVRYRRAGREERAQMKWFAFAAIVNAVLLVVTELIPGAEEVLGDVVFGTSIALLPVSIAIGVLKYRLYDIDIIINRALVYSALTALLIAAYAGGVLLFRSILQPVAGENDVAVAASTLAVAALFRPLRARVQAFIDRRFYRSRYDAQRTLERFALRLRDEMDVDVVTDSMLGVVADTVQPRHASVWVVEKAAP